MLKMLFVTRRAIAVLLCAAVGATGCATTGGRGVSVAPGADRQAGTRDVLAEYVRSLAPGSPIKVGRTDGGSARGTLMKVTDQMLILQPRTRIPEPPVQIALNDVLSVTPDSTRGTSLGKAIGIGIAAGAGAALAVFMIIAAIYAD